MGCEKRRQPTILLVTQALHREMSRSSSTSWSACADGDEPRIDTYSLQAAPHPPTGLESTQAQAIGVVLSEVYMALPPPDELLTPGAVAALLFVDPKTVTRWAVSGRLHAIRTPGGHRRYLRSDVLAIMAGVHPNQRPGEGSPDEAQERVRVPAQLGSPTLTSSPEDIDRQAAAAVVVAEAVAVALEAVATDAAETVVATAAAVTAAARRAAEAAQSARDARELAAAATARRVARDAERTATRVHIRADVAARQVKRAAELAAEDLVRSLRAGTVPDATELADVISATARAAADETSLDTLRAATAVANEVTAAATRMADKVAIAEDSFAEDVTAAAHAVEHEAQLTAVQVALETDARAAGVAMAAREAAAALLATPRLPAQSGSVVDQDPLPGDDTRPRG
jgi:hypothetical protein